MPGRDRYRDPPTPPAAGIGIAIAMKLTWARSLSAWQGVLTSAVFPPPPDHPDQVSEHHIVASFWSEVAGESRKKATEKVESKKLTGLTVS